MNAQGAIRSGIPWFDDTNKTVSAHGACIVQENGRFYLFGECKGDSSNAFVGFNCYSSTDLYRWKFERQVLPIQQDGSLGPNRVGERVKVMKCPKTGEFVMYMHTDNLGYNDPCIGYATSPTIDGEYTFRGALLFNGSPIRKWDMGVFQDSDGSGYLLIHHGNIFKLSDDYKSITAQVIKDMSAGESPAIVKKGCVYFWLTSRLTSWERNDNDYYTATSLAGPWTKRGIFAPEGTRIGFYGLADSSSGYANVLLQDKKGKTILTTMVDMYCKYPGTSLKFLSPVLPKGTYKLTVSVLGMHPVWSNKKGTIFGSVGDFVKFDHLLLEP